MSRNPDGMGMPEARTVWQTCSVNCGSRCALRFHVADGNLEWVESDLRPEEEGCPQMRACLKGRAMRYWLNSPERLNYPLRRVGARGEGRFERISWDEALDEIAAQVKRVVETYGNEAVYVNYGTGLYPAEGSPFERLMNCYGGYLGRYGDYSCAQLQSAMRCLYGDDGYYTSSTLSETEHADLVVLFGSNPAGTRMGGASGGWEFRRAREKRGFRLISIDPRHTEILTGNNDEWIPLRPGTDAAFVCGVAYELIVNRLVDQEFLDTYCIGYDRKTLPASAPENGSYKDYILGTGADGISKTPQWASAITGVPAARIVSFAREIAEAKALFVAQGWGPQRHDVGECSARAIPMLAILTGNVGLPGTNSGARERFLPFVLPEDPIGKNPVEVEIPVFMWAEAVARGRELTAWNAGVRGLAALQTPIKLIFNHAGNCLTNQHADINRTHDILADESLCEFIVVCDVQLTDSARYADILLPDIARAEQAGVVSSGSADMVRALVRTEAWAEPGGGRAGGLYERRRAWDVARDLARRLGVGEEFCRDGETYEEVARRRTEQAAREDGRVPSFEALDGRGLWRAPYEGDTVAYAQFRADPEAHPLKTRSGKIEIYSETWAYYAKELDYDADQVVSPLPVYAESAEGPRSALAAEYPFQLIGYHCRQRTHSTYGNVAQLQQVAPHEMLVNTLDAQALGVESGQRVLVENARGQMVVAVRVTPCIMPGVLACPQGAWHRADMGGDRVDWGGCINTLTSARPTPVAHGNAQHTNLVRVRRLDEPGAGAAAGPAAGPAAVAGAVPAAGPAAHASHSVSEAAASVQGCGFAGFPFEPHLEPRPETNPGSRSGRTFGNSGIRRENAEETEAACE